MRLARLLLPFAVLTTAACGGDSSETAPGPAPQTSELSGTIAFTIDRDGWGEIWTMGADGGRSRRLTERAPRQGDSTGNRQPRWSPDEARIAYVGSTDRQRESERAQEIFVMDSSGNRRRQLTSNQVADFYPAWSPDGRRLVFARLALAGAGGQESALVVVNADGTGERVLVREASSVDPVFFSTPAWSPDGEQIAYTRAVFGESDIDSSIHVIPAEGGTPERLQSDAGGPAWSPDGGEIAFTSSRDRFGQTCFQACLPSAEIYVMDADGGDVRRLTKTQADDSAPTFSPDGRWIAFVSDRSSTKKHTYQLYAMGAAGGKAIRLTREKNWTVEPDWAE